MNTHSKETKDARADGEGAAAAGCCPPGEQATCCAPSEKASCCGSGGGSRSAEPRGCGCR